MIKIDNLNTIVNLILDGKTIDEVAQITHSSKSTIHSYIKALNNPNSNVYNFDLYCKIREKQQQNMSI